MHEVHLRPCVFGCPANDCWTHYLDCIPLWHACFEANGLTYTSSPEQRLGMCMLTDAGPLPIATPFSIYHRVKHDITLRTINYEAILELARATLKALQ